ncbi:putative RNA methyltransferase [Vreelandella maris]|uniref:Methyltransferase domain-containing protein n=1 Tax=Vreelandella maris TaxID=2729617 RepID=A0A7Y6RC85_9GAMM|nr:methyltransferase domain-containing protein [Halomonas maris]NVF14330.1 methyltransferase domain-containing protein [Halomonas maris]|tara:strand:- start:83 stop:952 length:870 start_codon:yes stop_codon:yes gene_type:complete
MSMSPFQALACPLDGEPLQLADNVWRCAAGHSFDIAKQGYVNLLPVQQKRSHDPGDSKTMVAARQRFLNAGHYQPIADAISSAVLRHIEEPPTSGSSPLSCLDAGCGEGYYLRQLAQAAPISQSLALIGLDISKWAVLAAAKQDNKQTPTSRWVVSSNAHLPVEAGTLDSVLCMFGFPVYSEFSRVLKAGGVLLQVEAGPDHLRELREIIYPTLKPERSNEAGVPEGFAHHSSENVRYTLALKGAEEIADLLAMTPHLYRASVEGRARAAALEELVTTVEVRVVQWLRV